VELIEESPGDFKFGEAAVKAAWKRRFYPKVEDGKATSAEGIEVKYNFSL